MEKSSLQALRAKLHEEACARNEHTYIDPESHLPVFTRVSHLERGSCCNSGCRHCPYGFVRKIPLKEG